MKISNKPVLFTTWIYVLVLYLFIYLFIIYLFIGWLKDWLIDWLMFFLFLRALMGKIERYVRVSGR